MGKSGLALIGLIREVYGVHIPKEEQGEFVALPRSGSVALDLDPRSEEDNRD